LIQDVDEDAPYQAEHICEPSPDELLGELLPRNVYVQLFSGMLETSTSEHAARMAAMDNATKACNDMIDNLTLAYNKARQAAVTAPDGYRWWCRGPERLKHTEYSFKEVV
jgi:F-type H+-transporting ATPase subunit gamma